MKKNKIIRYGIGLLALLILLLVIAKKAGWVGGRKGIEVTTERAALKTIVETVAASGKVQPELEVKISPDVSGEIVALYVKEGDIVKKGDLLCKINPDIYLSNLDRMLASVNSAKANYANAKARLAQIKAQFYNIEANHKRNKQLFEQNTISQADWDASKAAYEGAKADVEAAEQTVSAAEFSIKTAQASLKEAQDNLTRTTIVSPIDGKISMLNVEKGERVVGTSQMAGTEIMRVANLKDMEVNVDVNENDIVRLTTGDTADIEIDAYLGRKFKGVVTEIANSANTTGITADQVTNFTVKIKMLRDSYQDLIPADDPNFSPFRPGMSATVDIRTETAKDVIAVPIQAVTSRDTTTGKSTQKAGDIAKNEKEKKSDEDTENQVKQHEYVFVFENNKAVLRKVITGIQDNNYIEIKQGLDKGAEIITGPYVAVSKLLFNNATVTKVGKDALFSSAKQ